MQINIKTFEKMETLLEDYALAHFIEENDHADSLSLQEAKEFYKIIQEK